MAKFIVLVAAQNLAATVYDTDDLSTVRGSSLALLEHVRRLASILEKSPLDILADAKILYSGASELLALVEPRDPAPTIDTIETQLHDALRDAAPDLPPAELFSFAVTAAAVGSKGIAEAHAQALARARRHQYETLSLPLPEEAEGPATFDQPCTLDRTHPAVTKIAKGPVSRSVFLRRAYGVTAKQSFVRAQLDRHPAEGAVALKRLDESGAHFSTSLHHLVATEDDDLRLPVALQGKIALVHLDGNSFGRRRTRLMGNPEHLENYSTFIAERQTRLLARLVAWMLDRDHMHPLLADEAGETKRRLRMEVLLWGGDEMVFAFPAWAAWDLVGEIEASLTKDWTLPEAFGTALGEPDLKLTHAIGLLYANYRTPIRQLRKLADELVAEAKAAGKTHTLVSAFACESLDFPLGGLAKGRRAFFDPGANLCAKDFVVGPDKVDTPFHTATKRVRELRQDLGKSFATNLAVKARDLKGGIDAAHREGSPWLKWAKEETTRVLGGKASQVESALGLGETFIEVPFRGGEGKLALPLLQLLHLWDYIEPLGPPPEAEQAG